MSKLAPFAEVYKGYVYGGQGRIQELKGGGAEVKYVHARIFHAHFAIGVLRVWREKARRSIKSITVAHNGVMGKDVFPLHGARKKNSVNYTNCIHTIDCLCSKSTSRSRPVFSVSEHPMQAGSTVQFFCVCSVCVCVWGGGGGGGGGRPPSPPPPVSATSGRASNHP